MSLQVTGHEEWKDIKTLEGRYWISNLGRVKSKNGLLKDMISTTGYYYFHAVVNGKKKIFRHHRLVAQSFVHKPIGKDFVNHIDGNKLNNTAANLEWVTQSENNFHAYSINLKTPHCKSGYPTKRSRAILKISEDGSLVAEYASIKIAALENNIHPSAIYQILRGKSKYANNFHYKLK